MLITNQTVPLLLSPEDLVSHNFKFQIQMMICQATGQSFILPYSIFNKLSRPREGCGISAQCLYMVSLLHVFLHLTFFCDWQPQNWQPQNCNFTLRNIISLLVLTVKGLCLSGMLFKYQIMLLTCCLLT